MVLKRIAALTPVAILLLAHSSWAANSGFVEFDTGILKIINLIQTDAAFISLGLGFVGAAAAVIARSGMTTIFEYAGIGVAAGTLMAAVTTVGTMLGIGALI